MRRILLLTVLILGTLPAASASGAAVHHSSNVTIDYVGGGTFEGKVKSPASRCERSRAVDLYYDAGTTWRRLAFTVVDSDTTDQTGNWSATAPEKGGDYKAKAHRKSYRRDGRRHVCDPATSEKITLN